MVPIIQFFSRVPCSGRLYQFDATEQCSSDIVARFIREGFSPIVTATSDCPKIDVLGWAMVSGEDSLRNDWHTIPFDRVYCLIYWNSNTTLDSELYNTAKIYFEHLIRGESVGIVTRRKQHIYDTYKPKRSSPLVQSPILSGTPLPDGRQIVATVVGGEFKDKVDELISSIKSSF